MDVDTEQAHAPTPDTQQNEPAVRMELEEILEQHREWLESNGESGRQADLSRAHLEGADLTDAHLRAAVLNRTILSTADLLLADLQGASLLQANLQFANLLGTKFGNADLQGANLEEATGLLGSQLAGANLRGAVLPAQLATFAGLENVHALARRTGWLIL